MGFTVDGFGLGRGAEKARRISVAFAVGLFGERFVAMRSVGFALEGGVEVVERLGRDTGLRWGNRRDRGADQEMNNFFMRGQCGRRAVGNALSEH